MHLFPSMKFLTLTLAAVFLPLALPSRNFGLSIQTATQTPVEAEIQRQRQRLSAADPEERRDALMKLGAMRRASASRQAVVGLTDASPIVRAVATKAILSLPAEESVTALLPLVSDKDEFVRREVAYSLGLTHSRQATEPLTNLLVNDKEDGVRAAAAVALGDVGDENAVVALANVLPPGSSTAIKTKKREKNVFVLRAAARSLGQIRSKAGVPALIAALINEKYVDDVRREAASALGQIGDPAAVPALRSAANSEDPYLSHVAYESLRKIAP
jgi:HEAT repeat protein